MAGRIVFQSYETKLEDKTVLRQLKERGNDANMDSADSVFIVLPVESKVQELGDVVHEFHISNQDDTFSTGFSL